jgi:hypothetical protein
MLLHELTIPLFRHLKKGHEPPFPQNNLPADCRATADGIKHLHIHCIGFFLDSHVSVSIVFAMKSKFLSPYMYFPKEPKTLCGRIRSAHPLSVSLIKKGDWKMTTSDATEKKPLWLLIEENILALDSKDLAEKNLEATIQRLAVELDNTGYNVSGHGGNMIELRWAVKDTIKAGKPLMTDLVKNGLFKHNFLDTHLFVIGD